MGIVTTIALIGWIVHSLIVAESPVLVAFKHWTLVVLSILLLAQLSQ